MKQFDPTYDEVVSNGIGSGIEMTVKEARELIDWIDDDDLASAIDKAQGDVHSGEVKETYILLKIVP